MDFVVIFKHQDDGFPYHPVVLDQEEMAAWGRR